MEILRMGWVGAVARGELPTVGLDPVGRAASFPCIAGRMGNLLIGEEVLDSKGVADVFRVIGGGA
jgi:hypothetical protein